MKTKNGISLIVLVITIVVMIILAATIIISLSNNGIIGKANEAVGKTNLKNVQEVAQVIWSDIYLENLKKSESEKLDYQTEVTNRLEAQNIDTTKYDINADDNGVTVELKGEEENWVPVFTGRSEVQNAICSLGNTKIFKPNRIYRITLEFGGNVHSVVTKAIYVGVDENGMDRYYLFGIDHNNELIAIESLEDAEQKMANANPGSIFVAGLYMEQDGQGTSMMFFDGATSGYTVTKIEEKEVKVDGTKIFEGNLIEGEDGFSALIEGVTIDITKQYLLVCDKGTFITVYDTFLTFMHNSNGIAILAEVANDNAVIFAIEDLGTITIYEIGNNPDIVAEGSYIAQYIDTNWVLISGGITGIPETVAGKEITVVSGGNLVNYDREVDIIKDKWYRDVWMTIKVAKGVSPQKIYEFIMTDDFGLGVEIDLTELDNLVIPTDVLEYIEENCLTAVSIYVSSDVIEDYEDYSFVEVKP